MIGQLVLEFRESSRRQEDSSKRLEDRLSNIETLLTRQRDRGGSVTSSLTSQSSVPSSSSLDVHVPTSATSTVGSDETVPLFSA